jgi:hypothetical protein
MGRSNNGEGKRIENGSQQKRRKPYLKPRLTNYGSVEKLTQGAGGSLGDVGGTRTKRP